MKNHSNVLPHPSSDIPRASDRLVRVPRHQWLEQFGLEQLADESAMPLQDTREQRPNLWQSPNAALFVEPSPHPTTYQGRIANTCRAFDVFNESVVAGNLPANLRIIERRIGSLREYAKTENLEFSDRSEADFRAFFAARSLKSPSLLLLKNGNLRAVWKDASRQIGLQFLGDERGQFVLLDGDGLRPNQIIGTHSLSKIEQVVIGGEFDDIWQNHRQWTGHYRNLLTDHWRRHSLHSSF